MTAIYYQKHKEKLREEARERYQNLSEEEKEKKQKKARYRCQNLSEEEKEKKHHYHHEGNKNLSKEEKEKKMEYMRNYYSAHNIIFLYIFWVLVQLNLFYGLVLEIKKKSEKFYEFKNFPLFFL